MLVHPCKKDVAMSNKDVAINADAQQQARAIALDKQQQLCKALPSVSRELEESLKLVKDVPDGASSTLINSCKFLTGMMSALSKG
ncbi:hypothetical protein Tco_1258475 [Tanacetum coccineum]